MHKNISRGVLATLVAGAVLGGTMTPALADTAVPEPQNNGPKNVIYMIGDGMGYNHVINTNVYQTGQSAYQTDTDADGNVIALDGEPVQRFEKNFDLVGLQTHPFGGTPYDPAKAWADFDWAKSGYTDSAAAGTAMATGVKTNNGTLGRHPSTGEHLINISEVAANTGRSAGVITSVQFNHATPAAFAVSNESRNNYLAIGEDMLNADYLDVVMGAGHPEFDNSGKKVAEPSYRYISQGNLNKLRDGQTDWGFAESKADFEAWAEGKNLPERGFGLAEVATTLQQSRAGGKTNVVGRDAFNDNVPSLETMTDGALNILGQNDEGFSLMIEGGAIDWTGHANDTVRNIEETEDFFNSVDAVIDWVETNSSWDETLVIVTADHETGYLWGKDGYSPITGEHGTTPTVGWFSGDHTNHLVPLWVRGEGAEEIVAKATMTDPIRGNYLDNVDPVNTIFDLWTQTQEPAEGDIPVEAAIPDPSTGGNGGGQTGDGSLVLSVAPGVASLDDARNAGDRLRLTGELPAISVTDTRVAANGWSVAGQASELKTAAATVRATHLGWSPYVVTSSNGAQPGQPVTGVLAGGEGLAVPQTLGSATDTTRMGTTTLSSDLRLEVPVDTKSGTYSGMLSVSLFPVD